MPNFQNLVRGEIMYQNHRNNENLEEVRVKDVNQHLYTTHTKYEQKQTNTKVVWCIHVKNLGLDPLTVAAELLIQLAVPAHPIHHSVQRGGKTGAARRFPGLQALSTYRVLKIYLSSQ